MFSLPVRLAALLSLLTFLLLPAPRARAWGEDGHHDINSLAVDCLPANLQPLYAANRPWIALHGVDPDLWRQGYAPEAPHHFIDLDTWGMDIALHFPTDYWTACGLYGQAAVDKNGVVPWRIGQYYGKLVKAFKEHDTKGIVETSAWLGHYVADIHVPFHAAANYDGQLSGQKGIHARFETALLKRQIKLTDLKPRSARLIAHPVAAAFGWAQESLRLTLPVLAADKEAVATDAAFGDAYYTAFGAKARPIAVQRLEEGAQDLASLWFSAWAEAGKPEMPAAADVHAGEPLDKRTHDPDVIPPVTSAP